MCCYASVSSEHHINQNKTAHRKVTFFIYVGNLKGSKTSGIYTRWREVLVSIQTMSDFLRIIVGSVLLVAIQFSTSVERLSFLYRTSVRLVYAENLDHSILVKEIDSYNYIASTLYTLFFFSRKKKKSQI